MGEPRMYDEWFADFGFAFGVAIGVWMASAECKPWGESVLRGLSVFALLELYLWASRFLRRRWFPNG